MRVHDDKFIYQMNSAQRGHRKVIGPAHVYLVRMYPPEFKETNSCVRCVHWGLRVRSPVGKLFDAVVVAYHAVWKMQPMGRSQFAGFATGRRCANCGLIFSTRKSGALKRHFFASSTIYTWFDLTISGGLACHFTCQMSRARLLYCRMLPFPQAHGHPLEKGCI